MDASSCMYWTFSLPSPRPETLLLFLFLPGEPGVCTIPFPAPSRCLAELRRLQGRSLGRGSGSAARLARAAALGFASFALNCFIFFFFVTFSCLFFPIPYPTLAFLVATTRDPTAERKVNTEICSTRLYLLRVFCCGVCLSLVY